MKPQICQPLQSRRMYTLGCFMNKKYTELFLHGIRNLCIYQSHTVLHELYNNTDILIIH